MQNTFGTKLKGGILWEQENSEGKKLKNSGKNQRKKWALQNFGEKIMLKINWKEVMGYVTRSDFNSWTFSDNLCIF